MKCTVLGGFFSVKTRQRGAVSREIRNIIAVLNPIPSVIKNQLLCDHNSATKIETDDGVFQVFKDDHKIS